VGAFQIIELVLSAFTDVMQTLEADGVIGHDHPAHAKIAAAREAVAARTGNPPPQPAPVSASKA
jgi:hypothetical protein